MDDLTVLAIFVATMLFAVTATARKWVYQKRVMIYWESSTSPGASQDVTSDRHVASRSSVLQPVWLIMSLTMGLVLIAQNHGLLQIVAIAIFVVVLLMAATRDKHIMREARDERLIPH